MKFILIMLIAVSILGIKSAYAQSEILRDGSNYIRWNEEKMCYDESNFPIFEDVPYDETLGYDPNWLVCTPKTDGCVYCMHPNQGYGNSNFDEKESLPTILPQTGISN